MIRIKDAAEQLNMPQQGLRLWLQSGHCPFGDAFKGSGRNYIYLVYEKAFHDFVAKKIVASDKATK